MDGRMWNRGMLERTQGVWSSCQRDLQGLQTCVLNRKDKQNLTQARQEAKWSTGCTSENCRRGSRGFHRPQNLTPVCLSQGELPLLDSGPPPVCPHACCPGFCPGAAAEPILPSCPHKNA
jgi:hypothetical protein